MDRFSVINLTCYPGQDAGWLASRVMSHHDNNCDSQRQTYLKHDHNVVNTNNGQLVGLFRKLIYDDE